MIRQPIRLLPRVGHMPRSCGHRSCSLISSDRRLRNCAMRAFCWTRPCGGTCWAAEPGSDEDEEGRPPAGAKGRPVEGCGTASAKPRRGANVTASGDDDQWLVRHRSGQRGPHRPHSPVRYRTRADALPEQGVMIFRLQYRNHKVSYRNVKPAPRVQPHYLRSNPNVRLFHRRAQDNTTCRGEARLFQTVRCRGTDRAPAVPALSHAIRFRGSQAQLDLRFVQA
jgi:hypothetical protein